MKFLAILVVPISLGLGIQAADTTGCAAGTYAISKAQIPMQDPRDVFYYCLLNFLCTLCQL